MFIATAPNRTYDGRNLSDDELGDGRFMPFVTKYLGSLLIRDCKDTAEVEARINAAGHAFGALRSIYLSPVTSFSL